MNAHVRRVTKASNPSDLIVRPARFHLGSPEASKVAQRLVVFTPTVEDIDCLLPQARAEMGGGAATEVVHRVFRYNPDSFWAIARRENFAAGITRAEGYVAFLMLNQSGLDRLFEGTLVATDPDPSLICRQTEIPAAIYGWGVFARGMLAGGIPLVYEKISTPRYREIPVYSRAATVEGRRNMESLGFTRGATHGDKSLPDLYVLQRGNVVRDRHPLYDTYVPGGPRKAVTVTVARSFEDLMRVVSIRGAVYVGEQRCPYSEEFDGNDLTGTNLLGYVGDEPVGCLRVRCFADFAKLERLAVRNEFRKLQLGSMLMRAGVEFCRAKGYRRIYGRAEKDLLGYYLKLGWRPLEGSRRVVFSDHEYVEIVFDTQPRPDAITLDSDPYVLMRPEGRWHVPGILERSAIRPVTRTSVDRAEERARA
jgi:predicted GNAT family N-acyltransferase